MYKRLRRGAKALLYIPIKEKCKEDCVFPHITQSRITNFLDSGVTQVMLSSLTDLGIQWNLAGDTLTVKGKGLKGFKTPKKSLYCGHSATTIRLLAGALAASGISAS